jgi:nitrite reductase/ring-hydroxylating ferredoxin subunit
MNRETEGGMTKNPSCVGCELGRRDFLFRASRAALGIAVALSGSAMPASARPRRLIPNGEDLEGEMAYPIPPEDGVSIDTKNEVILVRHTGRVYAFALACPHQNTGLRWRKANDRFECPKHHSKYAPDGKFLSGRATRSMDRLPIRRAGDQIMVDVDRVFQEDTDPTGWAEAVVTLS